MAASYSPNFAEWFALAMRAKAALEVGAHEELAETLRTMGRIHEDCWDEFNDLEQQRLLAEGLQLAEALDTSLALPDDLPEEASQLVREAWLFVDRAEAEVWVRRPHVTQAISQARTEFPEIYSGE